MDIKDRVKLFFFDRAPNSLLVDHVYLEFKDESRDVIDAALSTLEGEGFLEKKVQPNAHYPKIQRISYRITERHISSYPIKTEIEAAGVRVPRMIDGDSARGEDINSLVLSVNKVADAKISEMERRFEEQGKRYWSTLVAIFALFVSLFSVINVGVRPIFYSDSLELTTVNLINQSILNILPLALVLLVFVWVLSRVMNK